MSRIDAQDTSLGLVMSRAPWGSLPDEGSTPSTGFILPNSERKRDKLPGRRLALVTREPEV